MKISQFSTEQIIKILEQAEHGEQSISPICRAHGIVDNAIHEG
ncbi:MAG: transposase [Chloroflexota bacterium]|jgi:transposase-like protein|nr:transposase [Chloroflexota bacterium]